MMRPTLAIIASMLIAAVAPARADESTSGQPGGSEIVRGAVVKVEDGAIYVDLGTGRGVADGAPLRIKRSIKLRHPITRAAVEDWIPIGAATITQAGGSLSRAIVGDLVDAIKAGDIAEVFVAGREPVPRAPAPPPSPSAPPADPESVDVLRLVAAQAGAALDVRIAGWEHYLSVHPTSRFAAAIASDLETMHGLRDQMRAPTPNRIDEAVTTVDHHAPGDAAIATAIPLMFVLAQPDRVASAVLHYRVAGARVYRRLLLAREHDRYLRGIIPADAVQPPGVEYFVELSTPSGRSGLALGSPSTPTVVAVAPPPLINRFEAVRDRSSFKVDGQYLDFASLDRRAGDRRDRIMLATIDFAYRLDSRVESVGVGYGIYDGLGGFANRSYRAGDAPPTTGFRYGYADAELGGDTDGVHVAAGAQLIAGVGQDGFGVGAEGRIRIGHRDATNLLLLGRTIDQVGFVSQIKFAVRSLDHALIGISVGATDQPGGGDIGVILGTELELINVENFSVTLRGSWQGRSAAHGGIGGGVGLGLLW